MARSLREASKQFNHRSGCARAEGGQGLRATGLGCGSGASNHVGLLRIYEEPIRENVLISAGGHF